MKYSVLVISLVFFLLGCKNDTNEIEQKVSTDMHHNQGHWSYEGETGPTHWKELELSADCGGLYQSPINIVNYKVDKSLPALSITYSDSTHIRNVINNGSTIQYNFDAGDYITLNKQDYELKQFHFHEPAEHLIDGIRYPMELHLVHVNENGSYAVLAVMAKEGKGSEPFDFLESYLPLNMSQTKTVDTAFDMMLNLPEDKTYFNYKGSLTTPPCTEGVEWFVFKQPIEVSLKQVEDLRKLMPINNYRDEQPHNGREIRVSN